MLWRGNSVNVSCVHIAVGFVTLLLPCSESWARQIFVSVHSLQISISYIPQGLVLSFGPRTDSPVFCIEIPTAPLYEQDFLVGSNIQIYSSFLS